MAETTKQPEADYVELTVHQPIDSTSQKFKIKKKATFAKLMAVYSQKVGIPQNELRFRFDGQRLSGNDTVAKLDINDQDIIEVYRVQYSGPK